VPLARLGLAALAGLALALFAAPAGAGSSPEPPLPVVCSFTQGSGKVTTETGPLGATLRLTDLQGNDGTARLTFQDGVVPRRFTLRLVGAGGLERFRLADSRTAFEAAYHGATTTYHYDRHGRPHSAAFEADYSLTVTRHANGDIDLAFQRQSSARALNKELVLEWTRYTRKCRCG
jgi:hypothetical protein